MTVRGILKSLLCSSALVFAASCSGGGSGDNAPEPNTGTPPNAKAEFDKAPIENLTVAEVQQIIAQAVAEAQARNAPATIAITDRVGNVLAVFQMNGAPDKTLIRPGPLVDNSVNFRDNRGVQGLLVPSELNAIAKAITGAYLSSGGNAFSTRTASQIVQEHFPPSPTALGLESGPLFGVQISQLPCSDLASRRVGNQSQFGDRFGGPQIGPKRSPLGLAADPGGLPLYKNGTVVGAIGVLADGAYGFDTNILDFDTDIDELIAIAGTVGFSAPLTIRANRITVDGTSLRYSDADEGDLASSPSAAPSFASINGSAGALLEVRSYFEDTGGGLSVRAGVAYGTEASGYRFTTNFANPDAFVLSDGLGNNRYPPIAGTDGTVVTQPLTANEVQGLLEEAFGIMAQARGQIRMPLNSLAQVTISIVDTNGEILGVIRGPDAPIFGTDVSLQKARTAAFFSNPQAFDDLNNRGRSAAIQGVRVALAADPNALDGTPLEGIRFIPDPLERNYGEIVRTFTGDPNALTGDFAFADRSGGNLARPYFPDGELDTDNGPLSLPIEIWSPFATGLQVDDALDNIVEHIAFVTGVFPDDTDTRCGFLPEADNPSRVGEQRVQNGFQIFPGSVPIYRGDELIGGIGVSGDGIDQDDMISFLGLHNAGIRLGTINNAPPDMRADNIAIQVGDEEIRLRYVSCPFNPFVGSDAQNVCQGK